MQQSDILLEKFNESLSSGLINREPGLLYEAINYAMQGGGKRIRPLLVLLSCQLFDGNTDEAMHAALGIEVFHNFTLLHDDIMDNSPIRRGRETVYKKYNPNVAILAGDTMFAMANKHFLNLSKEHIKPAMNCFLTTAVDVCDGQQFDMDFERQEEVALNDYIKMIRLKTASLIGAALEIGAIIGNTSIKNRTEIKNFGENLGLAFQLQDDFLDTFGDEKVFGKRTGNDIITNKKTFLYLKALESADDTLNKRLRRWYSTEKFDEAEKIKDVTDIFNQLKIKTETQKQIDYYYNKSQENLKAIDIAKEKKKELFTLSEKLLLRSS